MTYSVLEWWTDKFFKAYRVIYMFSKIKRKSWITNFSSA